MLHFLELSAAAQPWEVLLFGHLELVWALDFLSVVMWLSRSVGQEPLAVGTPRSGVPLVHECV